MKPNLTVLQISANLPPIFCGIGDYTGLLSAALRERGVIVENWSQTEADVTSNNWRAPAVMRAWHGIDFGRFDIVHVQYEPFGFQQSYLLPLLLIKCRGRSRLVITFHEVFQKNRMQVARDRSLARASSALIVNDAGSAKKLQVLLGEAEVPISKVGVGSNIAALSGVEASTVTRGFFRLGYFGFLNGVKRVDLLIETLARLHAQGKTAMRLRLIGGFAASPNERFNLENQARKHGVADAIEWCVGLSSGEVAARIAECDLMILPFVDGATPRRGSFQACLQLGMPIITTRPLVEDLDLRLGDHVLIVEKLDTETLTDQILRAASDPKLLVRLQASAKSLSRQFTWTSIAARHCEIYDELVFVKRNYDSTLLTGLISAPSRRRTSC